MAIDTREKRQSAAWVTAIAPPSATPNASKPQAWRQSSGWGYSGILVTVSFAKPEDDDTDTAVGTYTDCDGYGMRPRRLHFQHSLNDARNAALTGYVRIGLDMFRAIAHMSLPNRGVYARLAISSRRAGEVGGIRKMVLWLDGAASPGRVREDTSTYTDAGGYEVGVPTWTFLAAANHARNQDLKVGATDQDAWMLKYVVPMGGKTGNIHRFAIVTARAGRPSSVARMTITLDGAGRNAATEVAT